MARILVIDDDNQIREMIRQMLTREGYEVVEAANGKQGAKVFREKPTDLVITDLIMPEKEGIETIVELRRDHPSLKIIAISGGGRTPPEIYLEDARLLGAHITLRKPFERQELLEAVRKLLKETEG
jgi:DNA-binding response OmpR family regulator